jgi:cytoskeletal protein CcmA (bactofilin family)
MVGQPGAQPKEARHMALFGQQRKDEPAPKTEPLPKPESRFEPPLAPVTQPDPPVTATTRRVEEAPISMTTPKGSESILSAGLTIEGKIEGNGNIRVAGRFKGHVNVKGELTIEPGASIDGEVKADAVHVGGEVRGQLIANSRVEFKESGTLIGDLKAGSLIVAAGSKMRGKVEFGWKEGEVEALHPPEPKTSAH